MREGGNWMGIGVEGGWKEWRECEGVKEKKIRALIISYFEHWSGSALL